MLTLAFQLPLRFVAVTLKGMPLALLKLKRTVSTAEALSVTVALNACRPLLRLLPFAGLTMTTEGGTVSAAAPRVLLAAKLLNRVVLNINVPMVLS